MCIASAPGLRGRAGQASIVLVQVVLDPTGDDHPLAVAGVEIHRLFHVADDLDDFLRIPDQQPDAIYPSALARLGFASHRKPWRSHLGGVSARKIKRLCAPGVDARLFRFAPGAAIPQHDHGGEEMTLVLTGGFADEKGVYHRGDVAVGRAGEAHTPMGLPGEPCICFAVSVGGYRFRNPLMSLAARWLE